MGKTKNKKNLFLALLVLAVFAAFLGRMTQKTQADPLQPEIAAKILRFHVLANSDSDEDQNVKIKVRDAVGHMLQAKLKDAKNRKETEAIVWENLSEIVDTAQQTLQKEGYHYGARARIADVKFPVKTYGNYTFPEGTYRALQITLGNGEGHNWWCVLYPGLCSFAQGGYALPAENDLVCGQYILRFRLVDWAHRLTARRQTVLLAG